MIKTQIQLPDELYKKLKLLASYKECTLAELLRRGAEYVISVNPVPQDSRRGWSPPKPRPLGSFLISPEELREVANMNHPASDD